MNFVPKEFDVPHTFSGPGFHLEPLAPVHNERDHEAWMSSIDHIHGTPGMTGWKWPYPMTLEENLSDMEMHHKEFVEGKSFAYSILDGKEVVGCIYIYPSESDVYDADVRSWVKEGRSELDSIVWQSLSNWLIDEWPFDSITYAPRAGGASTSDDPSTL